MHAECKRFCEQAGAKQCTFNCPVCKATHAYSAFRFKFQPAMEGAYLDTSETLPCPSCGHPLRPMKCQQCGQPMFEGTGVNVERRGKSSLTVHAFCVPKVQDRKMPGPNRPGCSAAVVLFLRVLAIAAGKLLMT
jgi:hypothetical protein